MAFSEEELQVKKERVLQYTRVGMSAERAFDLADLDEESRKVLESDVIFMKCVTRGQLELEFECLRDLLATAKGNIKRGKSDELRYMLGVLDPVRYGGGKKIAIDPGDKKVSIMIGEEYKGI